MRWCLSLLPPKRLDCPSSCGISKPSRPNLFFSGRLNYSSIKRWSTNMFWTSGITYEKKPHGLWQLQSLEAVPHLASFPSPSHTRTHPVAFAESCPREQRKNCSNWQNACDKTGCRFRSHIIHLSLYTHHYSIIQYLITFTCKWAHTVFGGREGVWNVFKVSEEAQASATPLTGM